MTNMNDIINAANMASAKSDRWLFVALAIVFMLTMGFFWRWILGDRKELADRLRQITDRHIETTEKLTVVVTNNTLALQQVLTELSHCRQRNSQDLK